MHRPAANRSSSPLPKNEIRARVAAVAFCAEESLHAVYSSSKIQTKCDTVSSALLCFLVLQTPAPFVTLIIPSSSRLASTI